jgi:type II secretion system protein N
VARQETIDENILPLRMGKKKNSRRENRSGSKLDPRKKLQVFAYSTLAFFSFIVFLFASLPLHRFSNQVLQAASEATRMNWDAKSVGFGFLLGPSITFTQLTISPQSQMPSADLLSRIIGKGLHIDELTFRPNLWQLTPIPWLKASNPSGSFSAKAFNSSLKGSFVFGNQVLDLNLLVEDLNSEKIPEFTETYGFEANVQEFELNLHAPLGRLAAANGEIQIRGDSLALNPSLYSQASMIKEMGKVKLGKISARSKLRNGQLTINEFSLSGKETDLEARLEGDMRLNDNIMSSEMNLILWLTPSVKLTPIIENPLTQMALKYEKKPNNSFALRIQGSLLQAITSPYKGN